VLLIEAFRPKGKNTMRKILLGTLGLVAMAAPASAADLAPKPYTKAPPPVVAPIYDWTGFYIGANGGWGQSHNCVDFVTAAATVASGCGDGSGGIIGGQIGYRWQTNQFVFGVEAQGDWADLKNTNVSLFNPAISTTAKTDGIGLFTGQLGWAWNTALLYVKGGAAVTGNRFDIFTTNTGVGLNSVSSTRWGGTLGAGFEYGFAPNWSVGFEYDHLFMGDANNSFSVAGPLAAVLNDRIRQDVDMVTIRFNYRFGGYGAPLVARY
jgi:outer membrane immunogenic protein